MSNVVNLLKHFKRSETGILVTKAGPMAGSVVTWQDLCRLRKKYDLYKMENHELLNYLIESFDLKNIEELTK